MSKGAIKLKFVTEATLWKNFSEYIRRRDADENGRCQCITCGKYGSWKYDMECGHFVTRDKKPTKYLLQNNHAQCTHCNLYKKGDQANHAIAIDKKYGEGTAERLIIMGRGYMKIDKYFIAVKNEEIKQKLKELKATQNF